jgi:two-component system phosphate regulon sensor histidine kinase PhoR
VRRLLLVNALIFAVLAAATALAYYGYTATSQSSRDRELQLMLDLADEKVLNIESLIEEADRKLMLDVSLEEMSQLAAKVKNSGAAVRSVFVLDEQLKPVPDGQVSSRSANDAAQFRDWFLANLVPLLVERVSLTTAPVNERGHLYLNLDRPYLFSCMRRQAGGRTFYVVLENDLAYLIEGLLPQYLYTPDASKRLYQVFDDRNSLRYGPQISEIQGSLVATRAFTETWDGFVLRVIQKDQGDQGAQRRKRIVDAVLIAGSTTVIIAGLLVLGFAMRRERRLNALKSEFISNVSHELKTPLSIISMFGEMLAEGRTKSPEQAHEYAEIIWRESVRLGRLIDNVLDFAKIERGMGGYEFEEDADITGVVDRAIELSQRRVAAAEMHLEVEIEEDLPTVRLDANAYTLAVLNLIDNAIKYAATGKKIRVTLTKQEQRVVLAVKDWGQGIDPEEHDKIFDRFYRARAIRLKPIRGSGIGLALVQHIARAHGGEAKVQSKPGEGSTFSISVPVSGKR